MNKSPVNINQISNEGTDPAGLPIQRRGFLRRAGLASAAAFAVVGIRELSGATPAAAAAAHPAKLGRRTSAYLPDGVKLPANASSCTCGRWVDLIWCSGCCGASCPSGECCYEVYYNQVYQGKRCIAQHCGCCNMHYCAYCVT
jgi:hypothetical protein